MILDIIYLHDVGRNECVTFTFYVLAFTFTYIESFYRQITYLRTCIHTHSLNKSADEKLMPDSDNV